jgi:hypothetical protein
LGIERSADLSIALRVLKPAGTRKAGPGADVGTPTAVGTVSVDELRRLPQTDAEIARLPVTRQQVG